MSRVIDLRGLRGNFETKGIAELPNGCWQRTFGLWSFQRVQPGDYVLRPYSEEDDPNSFDITLHKIIEVDPKPFCGSDGNRFWTGKMDGLHLDELEEHPVLVDWLEAIGAITRGKAS